jgi:galactose mutarotase-like enzyme
MRDGFEFMCQNPAPTYARLAYDGVYIDSECASWDDMFPTIDPYTPASGEYEGITYPDHGEVCRLPMEVTFEGESAVLSCTSRLFAVDFEKRITPEDDGALALTYTIRNRGREDFPYVWAAHCMLVGTYDLRVETPYPADAPAAYMFGPEDRDTLPRDRMLGKDSGRTVSYKFYYTEPTDGGFLRALYTESGHSFEMDYRDSAAALPYVGLWINNGNFKGYYNFALECASAPYDAPHKAMEKGYCSVLPAGETLTFTVRVRVV